MDYVSHFCAKDCPETCGFKARIENGELKVDPTTDWEFLDNPFVCRKLKFFYNREVRNNASYSFVRGKKTSTEIVLDEIAKLLKSSKNRKILYYRGSGNLGYSMFAWDALFSQFENIYFVDGSPCDETGIEAHIEDFGICINPKIDRLNKVSTIVIFGRNAFVCSPHLYSFLKKISKDKHLIYIDPVRTQTARLANEFFQIKPGMDGVLVNAILNFLGKSDLLVNEPAKLTGLNNSDIEFLAKSMEYGETAIIEGYGLQRYTNGKNSIKWINRLAFHTGNIENLFYSRSSKEGLKKPNIYPKNKVFMSDVTTLLEDGYFDVIIVVASNPVMSLPDNHIWEKALRDKISIVVDTNFTQTSEFADYFLKVGGMFATHDIQGSYFFNKTLVKMPVINDISDLEAAREIAKKAGLRVDVSVFNVEKESVPERRYNFSELDLELPLQDNLKVRLLSLSNATYLNSQNSPLDIDVIYIPKVIAKEKCLVEGSEVIVENDGRAEKFKCKITDVIDGSVSFVYKSRAKAVNRLFKSRPTETKRAIAYNDTFVTIKRAE